MKRNMKQWVAETIANPVKKGVPVLSFPAVQLMDITVRDLISSSDLQAKGMKMVADKVNKHNKIPHQFQKHHKNPLRRTAKHNRNTFFQQQQVLPRKTSQNPIPE